MSIKKKALSGLVWTYAQQFGSQLINFLINLVLARLLFPSDFGTISLLTVFISISNVLISGGFTASLIRKKEADENDFNTIFILNIFSAIVIYVLIFLIAPFVEEFYKAKDLSTVLRIYSLTLIISSFGIVQRIILVKQLNFKKETLIALPSLIVSGIVGITMAIVGFGVWSLVWSAIARGFVNVMQLWWYSDWKPNLTFSKEKFRSHLGFSTKFTSVELIRSLFANIYPIILGKGFSLTEVGLFKQADALRLLPYSNIVSSVNKVTFPLYVQIQDEPERFKNLHSKMTLILFTIMCPIFVYMSVVPKDILVLFFTDKWVDAAPFLSILSIGCLFSVVNINNLNVLNAKGKVNLILKIELIDKIIFIVLISVCLVFKLGIIYLLYAEIIRNLISMLLKEYYCSKELEIPFGNGLWNLVFPFIATALSSIVVYFSNQYIAGLSDVYLIRVLIPIGLGMVLYLGFICVFRRDILNEALLIIGKKRL